MRSFLFKLAVIGNICFWITMLVRYWQHAAMLGGEVLNTIVVLGLAAIAANILWLLLPKPQWDRLKADYHHSPVLCSFNLLTFIAQLLYFYFLFI